MNEDQNSSVSLLVSRLGMDEHSATLLVNDGVTSIEELAYVPIEELAAIEGLSPAFVDKFRHLAREYLDRDVGK